MKIPHEFDTVIVHNNCYDGFTSAWVARQHSPKARFVHAQHGELPPQVSGQRVLIADFCYPREHLVRMEHEAASLLVLDHHKTAAEDLHGLDWAVFDMERSGAGLTWDTLFPDRERPDIVRYVEDRDLWRFALPGTHEYHAAMTLFAMEFENWDSISKTPLDEMRRRGRDILSFTVLTAQKLASRATIITLPRHENLQVWAVNAPVEFVSETAEILKNREPHLPILGWSWDGRSGDFYCSLRSRSDGPDVSAIAKTFGGGGHKHAAGFQLDKLFLPKVK